MDEQASIFLQMHVRTQKGLSRCSTSQYRLTHGANDSTNDEYCCDGLFFRNASLPGSCNRGRKPPIRHHESSRVGVWMLRPSRLSKEPDRGLKGYTRLLGDSAPGFSWCGQNVGLYDLTQREHQKSPAFRDVTDPMAIMPCSALQEPEARWPGTKS